MGVLSKGAERRSASRIPGEQVENLGTVKISAEEVQVIDVSTGGLLVECQGRLRPGTENAIDFVRPDSPLRVRGRVVRCELKKLAADGPRYQAAIALATTIEVAVRQDPLTAVAGFFESLALGEPDPDLALNKW